MTVEERRKKLDELWLRQGREHKARCLSLGLDPKKTDMIIPEEEKEKESLLIWGTKKAPFDNPAGEDGSRFFDSYYDEMRENILEAEKEMNEEAEKKMNEEAGGKEKE